MPQLRRADFLFAVKAVRCRIGSTFDMRKFTYICPHLGMHVQVDLVRQAEGHKSGTYEAIECQACTRLHFIDVTTGRLLGL
jgi:hypothetical protein